MTARKSCDHHIIFSSLTDMGSHAMRLEAMKKSMTLEPSKRVDSSRHDLRLASNTPASQNLGNIADATPVRGSVEVARNDPRTTPPFRDEKTEPSKRLFIVYPRGQIN